LTSRDFQRFWSATPRLILGSSVNMPVNVCTKTKTNKQTNKGSGTEFCQNVTPPKLRFHSHCRAISRGDYPSGVDPVSYQVLNSTAAGPERIPRIIHQTWKGSHIPQEWQAAQLSCRRIHPDFEYRCVPSCHLHRRVLWHRPWCPPPPGGGGQVKRVSLGWCGVEG